MVNMIGISTNIVIETMQPFSKLSSVAKEELSVNIVRICRNQASAINILTLILNGVPYNTVTARKRALVQIVDYEEEQSWDNNSSEEVLLPRVRNRRIIQVDITGGNLLDDLGAIQHQLDSIIATLDHPTGDTCDVTD
ncbi:uncharacterized protein LOC143450365 [Clavelina lepadiformis]|uniref:uncharacterized protein LOC143450365 n=1 Tax=Clavelina lepadiformis TaxID=159417 RepID=UPI0040422393